MSNRRRPTLEAARKAAACPDCDADVQLVEVDAGVFKGRVAHDDSCPWLAGSQERATTYGTPHQIRLVDLEETKP